ncbi:MAG: hypothetical protein J2P22_11675 [Nocardioides sp.]|nr:hypothetical protein [Nocardioides sp.]
MKKLMLLVAFGLGYVLGARAGKERYAQIAGAFDKVRSNPHVQETTHHAVDVAKQQAPVVADKVTSAASSAASAAAQKVKRSNDEPQPTTMAGPQGDLP